MINKIREPTISDRLFSRDRYACEGLTLSCPVVLCRLPDYQEFFTEQTLLSSRAKNISRVYNLSNKSYTI